VGQESVSANFIAETGSKNLRQSHCT